MRRGTWRGRQRGRLPFNHWVDEWWSDWSGRAIASASDDDGVPRWTRTNPAQAPTATGFSAKALKRVKTAVFTPIPSASVSTITAVKAGLRPSVRTA